MFEFYFLCCWSLVSLLGCHCHHWLRDMQQATTATTTANTNTSTSTSTAEGRSRVNNGVEDNGGDYWTRETRRSPFLGKNTTRTHSRIDLPLFNVLHSLFRVSNFTGFTWFSEYQPYVCGALVTYCALNLQRKILQWHRQTRRGPNS